MPRLAQTRKNFRTSCPQDKLEFKLFPSPAELITLTTRVTSTLTWHVSTVTMKRNLSFHSKNTKLCYKKSHFKLTTYMNIVPYPVCFDTVKIVQPVAISHQGRSRASHLRLCSAWKWLVLHLMYFSIKKQFSDLYIILRLKNNFWQQGIHNEYTHSCMLQAEIDSYSDQNIWSFT